MGNFKKISSINNSFLFGLSCFYGVLGTRNPAPSHPRSGVRRHLPQRIYNHRDDAHPALDNAISSSHLTTFF